ncbi:BRO-N domain-containing protein [Vibrio alginolyticus]|uniref:BRO-N domain-containing protein n=1 Tax=Vibrio alginolyticus TaxID=663 RepID=UPI0012AE5039|nr:BRO family protein [Vibrio alginolyticus]
MNKEIQIFDYDGMKVETILHENDKGKTVPYFHGSSVAIILGYENQQQAVSHNCTKVLKLSKLDIAKNSVSLQDSNVTPYKALTDSGYSHGEIIAKQSWIPESDVYRLVMKSTLPSAEKFQDWVCEEVLPKIRQDGMYIDGEEKVESGEMSIEEMTLKVHEYLQNKVNRLTLNDYFEINSLPTLA